MKKGRRRDDGSNMILDEVSSLTWIESRPGFAVAFPRVDHTINVTEALNTRFMAVQQLLSNRGPHEILGENVSRAFPRYHNSINGR
jgi:hypothetical protein